MPLFKRILWPVDFSAGQGPVVDWLRTLAPRHGAEVHLLHVALDLDQCAGIYDLAPLQNDFLVAAQAKLERLRAELADLPCRQALVACGDPVEMILDYAKAQGIDLIVLATHGRKGLEHAILGSVAENLLRRSPVPVLTINPHRLTDRP